MITSQGFGIGALVNVDKHYNKTLGMIVRQSRGYNWIAVSYTHLRAHETG